MLKWYYRQFVLWCNKRLGLVWVHQSRPRLPAYIVYPTNDWVWDTKPNHDATLTHKAFLPKTRERRNYWRATGEFFNPIKIIGED